LHAAQLVTLAGPARARRGLEMAELGIVENGGMLIRDGRIEAVGSSREIEREAGGQTEIIEAEGCVVMPGFVDAHTHLVFGGNRVDEFEQRARGATYQEIAAAGGGIRSTVRKTRAASEEELFHSAKERADWFLRNGTTTIEAKSGYGLTLEDELKILRVIRRVGRETPLATVGTFLGAHAIPPEFAERRGAYLSLLIDEMLPRVREEQLAEFADVFCERGYFDLEESRSVLQAAAKSGLGLRMHADQLTNNGGASLAAEIGALTADHLEQTDAAGIAAMARAGVQPVLLPASVYALGLDKYPEARAMISAGLAVVLASDFNPGSSPTPSLPFVLSLAITQMKMTPAEAITATTINAAASLRRADQLGSLETGKLAHFTIFACADYREIAYWVGASLVRSVFVRGREVFAAP